MPDLENEQTEQSTVTDSNVPEAFAKADAAITKEAGKQPPAGAVETEDTEVTETETEAGVAAATETEVAAETTEKLGEIDDDVLDVMRDFYDDDQIVSLAETNPELLEAIREELDSIEEPPVRETVEAVETPAKPAETEIEELSFDLDKELVRPDVRAAIEGIVGRVNEYGKKLTEQSKGLEEERASLNAQKEEAFNMRIDSYFDKIAKNLAAEAKKTGGKVALDLGNSSNFERKEFKQLSRPERRQVQLRSEIFQHAQVTSKIRRVPIEKAIEMEISKFVNQDGKAAEQRVLNRIENEQETYTNPPTRRLSRKVPQFADEAEAAEYRMKEAEEKAGLGQ